MADITVDLYVQAAKIMSFMEEAAIYFDIWHIYSRSIGD